MVKEKSEKYLQARDGLSEELQTLFDQLIEDYQFAATIHHGSPFVSYQVLAEIVKAGWRPTGKGIGQWKEAIGRQLPETENKSNVKPA